MAMSLKCPNCQTSFEIEESRLRASYGWASCPACAKVFIGVQNMMYKGEMADFRITDRESFQRNNPRNMAPLAKPQGQPEKQADRGPVQASAAPQTAAQTPRQERADQSARPTHTEIEQNKSHKPSKAIESGPSPLASQAKTVATPTSKHSPESAKAANTAPNHVAPQVTTTPIPVVPGLLEVDETLRQVVETGVFPGDEPEAPSQLFIDDEPIGPPAKKGRKRTWFLILLALSAYIYLDRARVAALFPMGRPVLEQACGYLSCTVPPLYDLRAVSKEGDSLIPLVGQTPSDNRYRLEVSFKNHAEWLHYGAPMMDLEIVDIEGNVLHTQEIEPRRMDAKAVAIAPRTTWSGSLELNVSMDAQAKSRVAGYVVRAKYPVRHAEDNPISSFLEDLFATRP